MFGHIFHRNFPQLRQEIHSNEVGFHTLSQDYAISFATFLTQEKEERTTFGVFRCGEDAYCGCLE
jgi:hypothetical protein